MSLLKVLPIVEGHGEVSALPILLRRVWCEIAHGDHAEVLTPIRQPRNLLISNKNQTFCRAVKLASLKLQTEVPGIDVKLILLLIDAEDECPVTLGKQLRSHMTEDGLKDWTGLVIANRCYESWFAAAADSLGEFWTDKEAAIRSINGAPESKGKGWVEKHFRGTKYSETVDQAKLSNKMDLVACRKNSASFDKLCRELEKIATAKCE